MEEKIEQFVSVTGHSPSEARAYINAANGDVEEAILLALDAGTSQDRPPSSTSLSSNESSINSRHKSSNDRSKPQSRSSIPAASPRQRNKSIPHIYPTKHTPKQPTSVYLTIFNNGFSINNGAFYSTNDPETGKYLTIISNGHMPKELLPSDHVGDVSLVVLDKRSVTYSPILSNISQQSPSSFSSSPPITSSSSIPEHSSLPSSPTPTSSSSSSSSSSTSFPVHAVNLSFPETSSPLSLHPASPSELHSQKNHDSISSSPSISSEKQSDHSPSQVSSPSLVNSITVQCRFEEGQVQRFEFNEESTLKDLERKAKFVIFIRFKSLLIFYL
ncbi:putative UBX domain-containing protein 1 C (Ubx1C) [Monocercomonoides exilis]|uniref:putative UBX domain-containing protein 1 C (Ubx1C) n=1 Tax=Monocercomonoides exilis TaxID=2049356 RepID=UPI003559FBE2|nr:putative UBX domain-containing protein 1 C (Ubx1C) [Monocercomonoides exilis]|eukprot:MONOS_9542.1-p1 / transcript=MONOS_9542.1 / gene=MONOS_9542 / organism=Monocercomonoides_exilis_PA203 / gene_product=UBX domain-containing protein 1 C (Ubx1C) / transcript_product=UBX domain-containing protein 1 C (Ubx1C) / location=Mono_scaffold00398:18897-20142(+) / protein_length=330 / sequence_SO=supercontig / SO=protein_coding / is_pseudo=false